MVLIYILFLWWCVFIIPFTSSTIDLNSQQLAVMESGHSLLKDASRRNTDSPENATTHSPEDACNLSMLENHSNFDSIPHIVFEDDRSTIVCEDTNSTVPLEGTRKITPVEGTSSKTHLEDSRTLIRNIGTWYESACILLPRVM